MKYTNMNTSLDDLKKFQDDQKEIMKFKNRITITLAYIICSSGFTVLLLNIANPSNALYSSASIFFLGLICVILTSLKKFQSATFLEIIGTTIIIIIMSYFQGSAYVFSMVSIFIIISAIYEQMYLSHILFYLSLIFMLIYVGIGRFTLSQTLIEPFDIALVNNIQVSLPIIILSYVLSYIIKNTFIKTINIQREQYKKLEQSQQDLLTQAQLISIKQISGGLAHDFNNLLTIVLGNISLFKEDERLPKDVIEGLIDIEDASKIARNLTHQLLDIFKESEFIIQEIPNLNQLIKNNVNFSLKGSKSSVVFEIDQNLWGIRGDSAKISLVIQNLLINADQSMKEGGILVIETSNITLKPENIYDLDEGDYVCVHIIDEGEGIPTNNQKKLFNLFFTTKSKGSGIGLSISKRIIKDHNGYIGFKSNIREGSDFFFLLPADIDIETKEKHKKKEMTKKYQGNVLIYEDNIKISKFLVKIMQNLGLTVYSASGGKSFLSFVDNLIEEKTHPNIFILDLNIPNDVDGIKMMEIIQKKIENPFIVLSSGYSDDYLITKYKDKGFSAILQKPYSIGEIKKILDKWVKSK